MDGFRRLLAVCWHSAEMSLSADHIPVSALQSSVGRNHGRVPPNFGCVFPFGGSHFRVGRNHGWVPPYLGGVLAFGGDVPFGGSHPCIRPTILRRAEPWTGSAECWGCVRIWRRCPFRRITSLYPPYFFRGCLCRIIVVIVCQVVSTSLL